MSRSLRQELRLPAGQQLVVIPHVHFLSWETLQGEGESNLIMKIVIVAILSLPGVRQHDDIYCEAIRDFTMQFIPWYLCIVYVLITSKNPLSTDYT